MVFLFWRRLNQLMSFIGYIGRWRKQKQPQRQTSIIPWGKLLQLTMRWWICSTDSKMIIIIKTQDGWCIFSIKLPPVRFLSVTWARERFYLWLAVNSDALILPSWKMIDGRPKDHHCCTFTVYTHLHHCPRQPFHLPFCQLLVSWLCFHRWLTMVALSFTTVPRFPFFCSNSTRAVRSCEKESKLNHLEN